MCCPHNLGLSITDTRGVSCFGIEPWICGLAGTHTEKSMECLATTACLMV